ncbi:MAG TPA: CopD family protein [Acidiferrobacter sp.]|nr:CopD family protein [Acidiferrobacter sp.]
MSLFTSFLIALHGLLAVIWVGGMFFAHVMLRPAAQTLEPSVRLPLWSRIFARFFPWVWAAVIILPASGYFIVATRFGGFANLPLYINIMQGIGIVMILLYLHIFFAPYQRLRRNVGTGDFGQAAKALGQIRQLVGINTILGFITIFVALVGTN